MTTFDPKKNFAVSTVLVAPVPALTGTTLQVAVGEGALFPATGVGQAFNAVVFPANAAPSVSNAEIVRVTRAGDAFTIVRTQEGTSARAIQVGDRIMDAITVKSLTDIENALATAAGAIVLTAQPVLEPGVAGQVSRGRVLTLADFTTLLGLTAPVAGWNLSDLSDFSGNGRSLVNKGGVTFGPGIMGAAVEAAIFTGGATSALYIADTGAADPFRIPYGTWGLWLRDAKFGVAQSVLAKRDAAPTTGWSFGIGATNVARFLIGGTQYLGATPIVDDRYHFCVVTYDGSFVSIYVDGALDAALAAAGGPITYSAGNPLNIGSDLADGATATDNPFFGRADEAFITQDVLSAEQVRMLYAAKVAHAFGAVPIGAKVSVRRQRRGAALAAAAFSATPLHLYNFIAGALTDSGSLGNALTNNNAATPAPAPDGSQSGAYYFLEGSSQSLSATDAGLPAGTAVRSYGCWFRTVATSSGYIIDWGTAGNDAFLWMSAAGLIQCGDIGSTLNSLLAYNDGQPHLLVAVADGAAADGLKHKLYVDGKLVSADTTAPGSITLGGANRFRIGAKNDASDPVTGYIARPFVVGYAMGADEVAKLYAQGSLSLGVSPKNAGDHVEGMDGTNVYLVADTLDSQNLLDLEVTA